MNPKHRALVLVTVCAVALVTVGGWYLARTGPAGGRGPAGVARPSLAGPEASGPQPAAPPATLVRAAEVEPGFGGGREVPTTVAWPIEVELELVRASGMPRAEGLPPLGSGATARLRGRVRGPGDFGVAATLSFEAGLNAGRTLSANSEGYFGATDLYPGLALIRVSGPGIFGSLRERRLVAGKETRFDLSYGLLGSLGGRVFGAGGEPLEGVEVELDGHTTTTDDEGTFNLTKLSGGSDLVLLLRKEGYATYYSRIGVSAGRSIPADQHSFRMERATSLRVSIPTRAGAAGAAMVVISPADTNASIDFAWHTVSPVEITPGSSVVVGGLPPKRVSVRVYHRGAVASPAEKVAILRPGFQEQLEFELAPARVLRGRVTDSEGLAVPGAEVRLEAPDRIAAAAMHLREMPFVFDTAYFPPLPPATQSTLTDRDGSYLLTAWSETSAGRYLLATSPDGSMWAGRVVQREDEVVDLVLEPQDEGRATLLLDFPARVQGLPVVVSIAGERLPEVVLEVSELLPVTGLATGKWRVSARWNGQVLFPGEGRQEFELGDELRLEIPVPEGAIHGQDEDTLLRAGRAH